MSLSPVTSRIARGVGANVYAHSITVVIQLAGVPILLHFWGPHLYGEWLILFAIPAYLTMTDLGFSQSAANDMTALVALGDREAALTVFQTLNALVFGAAGAVLLLVTVLALGLPFGTWMHFQAIRSGALPWVIWLLAAEVCVRLIEGITHAGFRSTGDYAFHVGLTSTIVLFQTVGVWVAAALGAGPLGAAAAWFGVRVVATPCSAFLLRRRQPWLRFGTGRARRSEFRRLVRPSLANLGMPFAQALNLQGLVLVVGTILGPVAVVTWSTLRTMTRTVLQAVSSFSHAFEPEFAAAFGLGDYPLLRRLFSRMVWSQLIFALASAVVLLLLGAQILRIWTRGRVAMDSGLFHWLLLSALASVAWHGAITCLKAANLHVRAAVWFVVTSALTLVLAAIVLHWWSRVADAGMALLVLDVSMALYVFPAAWRLVHGASSNVTGLVPVTGQVVPSPDHREGL